MGVYTWARQELEQSLRAAQMQGLDEGMALRALLSAAVECSKTHREIADLASELRFMADNLDDDRDYSFMRP
ncbi:hypothetical protein [Pseudomonas sp. TTU2014-080ASC]|uniref:hypothetical protein n=1 Tax=Pseudomonas sp. TTU2014-080ASC TaxID=1729724 RepID=UPI000718AAB8|nr:hypothetical protein [Pseudomonas sp. TTU2014-080ASC]KRW62820.1 4-hydroxy-3-methylbut-2-enyl diphosphate reductase [Pseudomonas sp. TTU2014-080ASC]